MAGAFRRGPGTGRVGVGRLRVDPVLDDKLVRVLVKAAVAPTRALRLVASNTNN